MKKDRLMTALGALVMYVTLAASAGAQVQTFEDYSPCINASVGIYGGVNYLLQWTCYGDPQPPYNPHSGTNRVYASAGGTNAASGAFTFAPTAFLGAWFSGSATVNFQLFFGGSLVATSSSLSTTATPSFLAAGYAGPVDRVSVVGNSVNYIMDDVTFGNAATVTPEPSTLVLMGSGLLGIAGFVGRRRRTQDA